MWEHALIFHWSHQPIFRGAIFPSNLLGCRSFIKHKPWAVFFFWLSCEKTCVFLWTTIWLHFTGHLTFRFYVYPKIRPAAITGLCSKSELSVWSKIYRILHGKSVRMVYLRMSRWQKKTRTSECIEPVRFLTQSDESGIMIIIDIRIFTSCLRTIYC